MSSSAAASAYWRVAGMSYLKYSNLCADLLRGALKQELRAKAKEREIVYFKEAVWKDGRPEKQSACRCLRSHPRPPSASPPDFCHWQQCRRAIERTSPSVRHASCYPQLSWSSYQSKQRT